MFYVTNIYDEWLGGTFARFFRRKFFFLKHVEEQGSKNKGKRHFVAQFL